MTDCRVEAQINTELLYDNLLITLILPRPVLTGYFVKKIGLHFFFFFIFIFFFYFPFFPPPIGGIFCHAPDCLGGQINCWGCCICALHLFSYWWDVCTNRMNVEKKTEARWKTHLGSVLWRWDSFVATGSALSCGMSFLLVPFCQPHPSKEGGRMQRGHCKWGNRGWTKHISKLHSGCS